MTTTTSHRPVVAITNVTSAQIDTGKLLLRLTLGILLLLHGIAKLNGGIDGVMGLLTKAGLPATLGYLVYVGEVLAPVLLIVGLWTRVAAWIVVGNMLVAVALVHMGDFGKMTPQGGWALELQAFFLITAVVVALIGAGRYSVGGVNGRWN